MCCITKSSHSSLHLLVYRGDNGGVSGSDTRVIETYPDHKVDVYITWNNETTSIPLVSTEGLTSIVTVEAMLIIHQCAYHSKNHSSHQIECHKNIADDRSIKVGSGQNIYNLDECNIYIYIRGALPYMSLRPCTDKKWVTVSHVMLTLDKD